MKPSSVLVLVLAALSIGSASAQQNDFGDLPAPFPTMLGVNGPRHVVSQALFLGSSVPDSEPDGAPSPNADGDDVNATDDEDAINPVTIRPVRGFLLYMLVKATNTTGSAATISGFVDWNNDGDFVDAGETASVNVPSGSVATVFYMPWNVPATAVTNTLLGVRLRLTTAGTVPPTGPAQDGEVEDFQIKVLTQGFDYGDLPDSLAGTASGAFGTGTPPDYKTRIADGGPSHVMKPGLYFTNDGTGLMAHLDAETDGQPTNNADGDDLGSEDDEYGLISTLTSQVITIDGTHSYVDLGLFTSLAVTNTTGTAATVYGFIDWNSDGDFDDPGEKAAVISVPGDGSVTAVNPTFTGRLPLKPSPMNLALGTRFRISTDTGLGSNGAASDGEVHDEIISLSVSYTPFNPQSAMDYGDLNDARYPTLWANNGARHVITQTLFMGNVVPDGEADGQSSFAANGDDVNGSNDEDGFLPSSVTLTRGASVNFPVKVSNVTGKAAILYGFVDWNDDGDFLDPGEQSLVNVPNGSAGVMALLPWTVPMTASATGPLTVRLRLSTDTGLGPVGRASDGEVEDFTVNVASTHDWGDLPGGYPTTSAANGARHLPTQALFLGSSMPDTEPDGQPNPTATGDNVNGTNDEDAINPATLFPVRGFPFTLPVKATNSTGFPATISAFIDWNGDGDFNDANETASMLVPSVSVNATFNLLWGVPMTATTAAPIGVRLRIATGAALPPTGPASDGEVEDFMINVTAQGIDYGDLPDKNVGTSSGVWGTGSPPDYKTRIADGGPSHIMRPDLYFADDTTGFFMHLDAEADGQPNTTATGDDTNGDDDENSLITTITRQTLIPDGAHSELEMELFTSLAVTNTTGSTAYVSGFIDVNSDGDFDDPGEQATVISIPGDASVAVAEPTFIYRIKNLTGTSMSLTHAMRFRISTDAGLSANGAASDGEVHDELISYQVNYTLPDPQSVDYGDLPNKDYPTLHSQNGARHIITQTLFMGNVMPDGEPDGLPTTPADGDDVNGGDDEDGFNPNAVSALPGSPVNFPVKCANNTGSPATLFGFVDWNNDGDFQDAGEQSSVGVPTGGAGVFFLLPWNVPATTASGSSVAVRLRLSTNAGLTPLGLASDGEVEDYFVEISQPLDFGDLPGAYPTAAAANGARHLPSPNLYLGTSAPDVENDGVPSVTASGDDSAGSDDEDAVNASSIQIVRGFKVFVPVTLMNNTGLSTTLSGFIDWSGDGDFADVKETASVAVSASGTSQTVELEFDVPLLADITKPLGMRLRLATAAMPATGYAPNGEVEDFMVSVMPEALDFGDLPDGVSGTASGAFGTASPPDYKTRLADGGPSHVLRPGLYFARDTVNDVVFDHVDPESDGQPSNNADGDDLNGVGDDDEWATYFAITRVTHIVDGAHTEAEVEMIFNHAVTNTTGTDARIFGFIDINSDGDFTDVGEQSLPLVIPTGTLWASTNVEFKFRIPYTGALTTNFNVAVRTRITTDTTCASDGPASDGEVQDDLISFSLAWTPNDYAMDYGDHLSSLYPTMWAQNGARHVITNGIFIGNALPDNDTDGHSSAGATGDDTSGLDDEDGFDSASVHPQVGFPINFPVKVTNATGNPAELFGFVDWNDDGDFADAGEQSTIAVPNGTVATVMNLPWTVPSTASTSAPVAVRLRLSTDKGLGPIGRANDGEVEDYRISVTRETDFGDLPDSLSGTTPGVLNNFTTISQADYRTRLADGGPWHYIRPDLALYNDRDPTGVHTDGEADGHPSADAGGDDLDGSDDEEVLYTQVISQTASNLTPTSADIHYSLAASLAIKNETGVDAYFTGFLDANNDGDFTDPGETASITIPSAPSYSAYILTFNPMVHLTNQVTSWTSKMPVRFRLSTVSGLGPDGAAADGEVEDYMITVSFTVGQWWPNIVIDTPRIPGDGTIDIGTPTALHPIGDFSTASDVKWRIGNTPLTGSTPSLSTSFLQSLGTGQVPYSVSGRTGPHTLRSHSGVFDVKDMSTFRTFMGQHSLTNETAAPDADADGDGITNLTEFAFGTDPGARNLPPHFEPIIDGVINNLHFTLPYLRRTGGSTSGSGYTAPDVYYFPQASSDLSDWTKPLENVPPPSGLATPPDGYEWGAVRLPTPIGGSNTKGFIRVQAGAP